MSRTNLTRSATTGGNREGVPEMHLMDAEAREEEALCGAKASVHDLTSVQGHTWRSWRRSSRLRPSAPSARSSRCSGSGASAGN